MKADLKKKKLLTIARKEHFRTLERGVSSCSQSQIVNWIVAGRVKNLMQESV